MTQQCESLSLKTTKRGKRVWLNNQTMMRHGFTENSKYHVEYFDGKAIVQLADHGKRKVAKGNIIDLENYKMANAFKDTDRVSVDYRDGEIVITVYHHTQKVRRRESQFHSAIKKNQPLRFGELFAGISLLSESIIKGLSNHGINTNMVFGVDHDRHAADVSYNSTQNWTSATNDACFIQDDLFTMDMSRVPQLDILCMGYPCVAFSRQQSKNRKRDIEHDEAGLLFIPVLEIINRANPALIIIENSDNMAGSMTDTILEQVLKKTGYKATQKVLKGSDFGDFEHRARLAKVYVSQGLTNLNLNMLTSSVINPRRTVSNVLEPIAADSSAWKDLSYLKAKNQEKHHSHKFMETKPDDTWLPVFAANYAKIQADSPIVPHPKNPNLHRIFTPSEHCNVRRITGKTKESIVSITNGNHHLQNGRTNQTKAHHLLGNSVSPSPWQALGSYIGQWALETMDMQTPTKIDVAPNINKKGDYAVENPRQFALFG